MTVFLAFLAGLLVGSFLNVCIERWPAEESVVKPRSHCRQCGATIRWYDNIPLASYLFLSGRCRDCGKPIPLRYPVVELLNGAIYAGVALKLGWGPLSCKTAAFGSMMIVLVFSDFEQYILPDEITLGGLAVGLAVSPLVALDRGVSAIFWLIAEREPEPWQASLAESVTAAALFGGLMLAVREVYYRIRGVDGLGLGDVKMIAMIGAFWGSGLTLLVLIAGSVVGAAVGSLLVLIGGKRWNYEMPYGSYLGVAAIAAVVWGDDVMSWYWGTVLGTGAG